MGLKSVATKAAMAATVSMLLHIQNISISTTWFRQEESFNNFVGGWELISFWYYYLYVLVGGEGSQQEVVKWEVGLKDWGPQ